jgi:hypothetical protein
MTMPIIWRGNGESGDDYYADVSFWRAVLGYLGVAIFAVSVGWLIFRPDRRAPVPTPRAPIHREPDAVSVTVQSGTLRYTPVAGRPGDGRCDVILAVFGHENMSETSTPGVAATLPVLWTVPMPLAICEDTGLALADRGGR